MLAKLIKLDLRFAYKKFLAMAALLLLAGVAVPFLNVSVLKLGVPLIFSITFSVVPILCVWLVVQHFHRNLFGNEGYLMFSLPVSATQLLISKIITTLAWFNLMLTAAAGLFVLLLRDQVPVLEFIRHLFTWDIIREVLHVLFMINVNALPVMMAMFFGISLATVTVRNKKIGHFWGQAVAVAGIALFVWSSIHFAGWTYLNLTAENQAVISVTLAASQWINVAISAVFCTLFFALTTYVMRRRLNLD